MENWSTVIVPTFYDEKKEIDREKLKRLADNGGVDIVTLKNALTGKGLGFILKTGDVAKIERLVSAFKNADIPCLPANIQDVLNEIKVINVKEISLAPDGLRIKSIDNQSYIEKPPFILVSDVYSHNVAQVKKAIINGKKVAIVSFGKVFVVNLNRVRVLAPDGRKGISQKANLINILERFEKERELFIDTTFFYQHGFFRNEIEILSAFVGYAFKNRFYGRILPEDLFVDITKRQQPVYDYKKILNPLKIFNYKLQLRFRDRIVYPPVFWVGSFFILLYLGARLQETFFFWLAFLIAFIVSTWKLFKVWKYKHLIEDIPTSKLRSVSAGLVEVEGVITSPKPVISPISGAPCVFFRYIKEVYVEMGRYSHWDTVEIGEAFAKDCVLKDDTGEIGINLKNARFFLTTEYTTNTTYQMMNYGLFGNSSVSYTEEYILDGQKVYVLGTAKPVSQSISYGKFLSLFKRDKEKLKKFDLNGDGVIDAEEWEKAQKKLKEEYLEYKQLKGQAADLIIDRDKSNGIFIVSNEGERNILKGLKIALPLYFVFSLIFLVLSLWLTIKIFMEG